MGTGARRAMGNWAANTQGIFARQDSVEGWLGQAPFSGNGNRRTASVHQAGVYSEGGRCVDRGRGKHGDECHS